MPLVTAIGDAMAGVINKVWSYFVCFDTKKADDPPSWRGVQMVEMPYLRTTSDDSSSETCFVLMDDVTDDPKSSFRTGIVRRGP